MYYVLNLKHCRLKSDLLSEVDKSRCLISQVGAFLDQASDFNVSNLITDMLKSRLDKLFKN